LAVVALTDDLSLADVIEDNRQRYPDVGDGRPASHEQLHDRACALASALQTHGLRCQHAGSRIGEQG